MPKQSSGVIKLKNSAKFSHPCSTKMPFRHHFIAGSIITIPISKSYGKSLGKISFIKIEESAIEKNKIS